ncbi:LOW QUALITY PROTEIN: 39S ribosomal protein L9, mitochondrial [Galemys pyrenaicus]|uniref:39S ribosomal protein L9, mitochondrial n=1 Tax=Galemys pyrenaicus TaxID=202257 RepID=A0A8J6AIH3_GALPY|nr:LOW QUALITY PROTEIN: 39S ribosomal protein L9, mitochondrial [Galemys pyrenaicus]
MAVYTSPENERLFEEELLLRQEGNLEKIQKGSEVTVKMSEKCHLEVGMKNNVKWELNPEIVVHYFLKKSWCCGCLPYIQATRRGHSYWWEVTKNWLDPMSVVNFERPRTERCKYWLAQQIAKGTAPTYSRASEPALPESCQAESEAVEQRWASTLISAQL